MLGSSVRFRESGQFTCHGYAVAIVELKFGDGGADVGHGGEGGFFGLVRCVVCFLRS